MEEKRVSRKRLSGGSTLQQSLDYLALTRFDVDGQVDRYTFTYGSGRSNRSANLSKLPARTTRIRQLIEATYGSPAASVADGRRRKNRRQLTIARLAREGLAPSLLALRRQGSGTMRLSSLIAHFKGNLMRGRECMCVCDAHIIEVQLASFAKEIPAGFHRSVCNR